MSQAPRSSTVHLRAIVAASLALGLVLAVTALAWAAPSLSIDFGPSGPTNDDQPLFGFTADADATVECSIDQGVAAYGPCTSATTHTPDAPLAEGRYTFRVRATDAALDATVAEQSFTVDLTRPTLSIGSGPSAPTNDSTPTFGFAAEAGATVACSIDQGAPAYGPCSGATTHAPDAPLAEGPHVFRVRARDAAGNEAEASRVFSVDVTRPSLSIGSGPSAPTNVTTPSFGFSAEAGATLECSIDQGSAAYGPCTSATTHAPGAPLAEGRYTFRVRATDAAGNQATATRAFAVDVTRPSLSIGSGPSGLTNDATPAFGFTAEAGTTVQCSIDQGTPAYGACTGAAAHAPAAPLADGAYEFRVRATDAAGNESVATRAFAVDATRPALSIDAGPSGPTNDATPTFGFTAEAGATLECSVDHGTPAYGACTSAASHTVAAALADGSYVFRVRATDAAGNQASASQAFSVDSTAPSLSIDSGPSGPTNVPTPSFGFAAEAGATVACSLDQGTAAYGPCTSAATYVVATPLAEGRYTFRVRAVKPSGSEAIVSRAFTVDTTPPSLSIGFGPSGTTNDSTPLFGFAAEAGATVECSLDQGAPVYGPCASATTHAAAAPLADGAYVFRVRATDGVGNQASATRAFTVDTAPPPPDPVEPGPDPTPDAPPVRRTPDLRLMSPFPLVRISGTLTSTGARIRLLSVRAPHGATVRITVTLACPRARRSSRRCRVLQAAGTVGRSGVVGFRDLARRYRSGTVIVVRVWSAERIGKYTRFTIVRGKAPRRVDQCLVPEATRGSRCPSA